MTDNEMLKAIFEELKGMKEELQEVRQDNKSIKEELQEVKQDNKSIKEELQEVKQDVNAINITLENETNRNIRIIAEGHTILSRKLDEALKVEEEKELLLIRVNALESDVEKLKQKIS